MSLYVSRTLSGRDPSLSVGERSVEITKGAERLRHDATRKNMGGNDETDVVANSIRIGAIGSLSDNIHRRPVVTQRLIDQSQDRGAFDPDGRVPHRLPDLQSTFAMSDGDGVLTL